MIPKKIQFKAAFTFMELLIVIALTSILVGISIPVLSLFFSSNQIKTTGWEMVNTIRFAQTNASNGKGASDWGVHFEMQEVVIFKGETYDPENASNERYIFPDSIRLSSILLADGGHEMIFNRGSGETEEYGTITLTNGSTNGIITINEKGVIDL